MARLPSIRVLVSISLAMAMAPLPASAVSSPAGDAGPSFNESFGCGVGGWLGPWVEGSGSLPSGQLVYGPWADFFGRNRAQIEGSLVSWAVPGSGGRIALVHSRLLPALNRVTTDLAVQAGSGNSYPVSAIVGWSWRTIAGKPRLSHHAFGNAIDINPAKNPYRADATLITDMPQWWVDAWAGAGFCWGGSWINLKDPMHLSWMGPQATPGYGPRPAPYGPLTTTSPFSNLVVDAVTSFEAPGDPHPGPRAYALADRSRDGSVDLYAVRIEGGAPVIEAAGSRFGYAIVGFRRYAGMPAALGDTVLADLDGDSRGDLIVLDRPGGAFTAYSDVSGFEGSLGTYPLLAAPDAEYAFGFFDDDWVLDLVSIERGPTTTVKVWSGASGFATEIEAATLTVGDTTSESNWAFALGDYDVDGITDVYVIRRGSPATVTVATGASRFLATTTFGTGAAVAAGDLPAMADYDGDGRDDLYVIGPGRLRVYLGNVRGPGEVLETWFLPNDPPPWDAGPECVGPFPCDQVGYVDDDGEWSLRDQFASDMEDVDFYYGNSGDLAFTGDWDCDGIETPGLYRPSDGYVYLRNSNDAGVADVRFFFGNPDDVPLAGDFNGDGCDTVSLYRPSDQGFFVINRLGAEDQGLGSADFSFRFGDPGDQPLVGDFNGDGTDDVALHRATTGLVYYRLALSSGPADASFVFGDPGDVLLAGDWDGDGIDTVGLFRPAKGRWYIKLDNSSGVADHAISYGEFGPESPVAGWFGTAD